MRLPLLFAALISIPALAQSPYLRPGERGVGGSVAAFRTSGQGYTSQTTTGIGGSLTGTVLPGVDVTLQLARQRTVSGGFESDPTGTATVLLNGYFLHTDVSNFGAFAGVTFAEQEFVGRVAIGTAGVVAAWRHMLEPSVALVPQLTAAVGIYDGLSSASVAATPALVWNLRGTWLLAEPTLGYAFTSETVTVGLAVGVVQAL